MLINLRELTEHRNGVWTSPITAVSTFCTYPGCPKKAKWWKLVRIERSDELHALCDEHKGLKGSLLKFQNQKPRQEA